MSELYVGDGEGVMSAYQLKQAQTSAVRGRLRDLSIQAGRGRGFGGFKRRGARRW